MSLLIADDAHKGLRRRMAITRKTNRVTELRLQIGDEVEDSDAPGSIASPESIETEPEIHLEVSAPVAAGGVDLDHRLRRPGDPGYRKPIRA